MSLLSVMLTTEYQHTVLDLNNQVLARRFKVLKRITCGSYSEIYLARNLSPVGDEPEFVVIKVLNLTLRGELEPDLERTLLENLKLEAYTLGRFKHPHIVHLYESGHMVDERSGRQFYYLVLEHIDGPDLNRLCRANPLSFEEMLAYVGQVSEALSYAHEHNTIHRDVKPNNILLSRDRRTAKLLDFGTARLRDQDNGVITRVGTAVYSAPEHYSLNATGMVTPAADIYSLAKTILFLLTGESPAQLAQKQVMSLPAQLRNMTRARQLLHVLRKATGDRPEDRYQSVPDFYKELCDASELTPVEARARNGGTESHKTSYQTRKHTRVEIPIIPSAPGSRLHREHTKTASGMGDVSFAFSALGKRLERVTRALRQKLAVRLLAVVVLTTTVLVVPPQVISWWRGPSDPKTVVSASTDSVIGKEAITRTDLNIRSGPGIKERRIGLAESSSHVRIVSLNPENTWCEVEVLRHGRVKEDPASSDHGWVNGNYLFFVGDSVPLDEGKLSAESRGNEQVKKRLPQSKQLW